MSTMKTKTANEERVLKVQQTLEEMLRETLQRGFHGTAVLELSVQDGTIQHMKRKVEQLVR
jgi:hypothetical protein